MDAMSMNKRLIQFQRAMFNTSYDSLKILQDQMGKIVSFWQHQIGMPEIARKSMSQWNATANKIIDDSKQIIVEKFDKIDALFSSCSDFERDESTGGEIMLLSDSVVVEPESIVAPQKTQPVDVVVSRMTETASLPSDAPHLQQVVWQTVQVVTNNDKEHVFSPKDVTQVVLKKYPDFHRSTVGCQIISDCVNHTSRHRYPGGKDRYWCLGRGKYRMYDPERDILKTLPMVRTSFS